MRTIPRKVRAVDPQWIRAPRVAIDLEVKSKTIGTNTDYRLSTVDVSRSGILLEWARESKVPFIVNTLLEMTIDPNGDCLDRPVTCLGKVVRRESTDGHGARLGIQIVQIDHTDLHAWEGCLNQLEQRYGIDTSSKSVA